MKTITIKGMMCGHCKKHVEKALRDIGLTAEVNVEKGVAVIAQGSASADAVRQAVADAGYEVTSIE